ncbi:MAG: FAD-binding oxidoreductase [Actinobacteria bacterium]|nr:FAD-binding oxidoreductase [Actinomycetota bacterium]
MSEGNRASRSYDVAVVGAGIIGLSVALHLLEAGEQSVCVVERTGVAAGASGVQPGGVRQQWSSRVNCLLAQESVHFYLDIANRLDNRVQPVLEQCGYIFLAHSEDRLSRLAADVALQNEFGVPSEIVDPDQAAERVPDLQIETVVGAAWCQEDGYFDRPQAVVAGFAEAAERHGAVLHQAEVERVEPDGQSWQLSLAGGDRLGAGRVVLATGYDSPALLEPLGIEVPIGKELRSLFLSEPIRDRLLDPMVASGERSFAAKQLADGRVLASDTTVDATEQRDHDARRLAVRTNIEELLPRLQYVSFPIVADGFYDVTPDHQPIITEVQPSLWVAAGFSGHGFMLAPAIGRRVAGLLQDRPVDDLLDAFSLERFSRPITIDETEWVV